MQLFMCKSKIHRATITDSELHYEGSITIDKDLMEASQILAYEKVQVVNVNNGNRLETYVIEGERGSGVICLNGAAARQGHKGDKVIIISYALLDKEEAQFHRPVVVKVDHKNHIVSKEEEKEYAPSF